MKGSRSQSSKRKVATDNYLVLIQFFAKVFFKRLNTSKDFTRDGNMASSNTSNGMPNSLAFLCYKMPRGLFSFLYSPKLLVFVLNKGFLTLHTHSKLDAAQDVRDPTIPTSCEWAVSDPVQCTKWGYDPSKSPCIGMITLAPSGLSGAELIGADKDNLDVTVVAGSQGEDTNLRFLNRDDKILFCRLGQSHIDHSRASMMAALQAAMQESKSKGQQGEGEGQ